MTVIAIAHALPDDEADDTRETGERVNSDSVARRAIWVARLADLSGSFSEDSARMVEELRAEIAMDGLYAQLDHLRNCGAVPEWFTHDSSEEKLYSKYTDAVVSESLAAIGLRCTIITARADAADVQARGRSYSLVADAKAFRLSRTAKNQKDFKVQAMDGWRGGFDYAMVVCPIYQLPSRASQIHQQAIVRNVCLLSYSHLAVLVRLATRKGQPVAEDALGVVLRAVMTLHPSKSAVDYWTGINQPLVGSLADAASLWTEEKVASLNALSQAKGESLHYLRMERDRLLGLSHREALDELIRLSGLDSRIGQVERVQHGQLLGE